MSEEKRQIFEEFARIGQAVSSAARLLLLDLLAQGEKPVELLAEQAGLGLKNASAHLGRLRTAKLVETRREGTRVFYRLADPLVFDFLRTMQTLGVARLPEVAALVRDCFESPTDLEGVEAPELLRRVRAGEVTLIDVRPEDEYGAGHIPGALSMPVEELETRLSQLDSGREVVAYCRGPYCMFALDAVSMLRARGMRASRLARGLPDWRAAGLPVAVGSSEAA